MRLIALSFLTVIGLSGCAQLNSIHRTTRASASEVAVFASTNNVKPERRAEAKVISVDAKQRHLLIAPNSPHSQTGWRFCAEAAPDIFSAFASSFDGNFSSDKTGGKGGIAGSIAETAATIERTQTINLLRESMYRTCERYLSGALNESQFTIQAARDQKSMVAVLAIEQLTGALRSKSTIISGPATMAAQFSGDEAAKLIKGQIKNRDDARAKADASKLSLQQAKDTGICDPVPEQSGDNATTKSKADPPKCQALTSDAQSTVEELVKAEASLADAIKLASNLSSGGSASTMSKTAETSGIGKAEIDYAAIKSVADAVTQIATTPLIDESLMYCIGRLTAGRSTFDDVVLAPDPTPEERDAANQRRKIELEKDSLCLDVIRIDNERKNAELRAATANSSAPIY